MKISLIPAVAGRRSLRFSKMSQEMSRAAQQRIAELLKKTKEMNEKYEKDKQKHQE